MYNHINLLSIAAIFQLPDNHNTFCRSAIHRQYTNIKSFLTGGNVGKIKFTTPATRSTCTVLLYDKTHNTIFYHNDGPGLGFMSDFK